MDNFGFLNEKELSYIIYNQDKFSSKLIEQVSSYCERLGYSLEDTKSNTVIWNDEDIRLKMKITGNELLISKTDEAKKDDVKQYNALIPMMTFLVVGVIWGLFSIVKFTLEEWYFVLILPLLFMMLYSLLKKRKKAQNLMKNQRTLNIHKQGRTKLFENRNLLYDGHVKAVNLFWRDFSDSNYPSTRLELRMDNRIAIIIDSDGEYHELLNKGDRIATILDIKINVFTGESPFKENYKL